MNLDELRAHVKNAAAIRGKARLQPVGGQGDKVFPPSHANDERNQVPGARYAHEKRRLDGKDVDVVLLDSVQSQANRMEEALYGLWRDAVIPLPVLQLKFDKKEFPDLQHLSSLTVPHRIADALLRDSMIDDKPFRKSELGLSFTDATAYNAAPLFNACPTALVFGLWDSTGPKGGLGFKLARNLTSEIVGIGALFGTKTSSRIDPAGTTNVGTVYSAKDGSWTLDEAEARLDEKTGKPVPFGKDGKVTSTNHSNVPPTLDKIAGGITFDHAEQTVVLSLAGLRKLSFGSPEESDSARVVLAALGLLAVTASQDRGYDMRSRCQLVPEVGHALSIQVVAKDGSTTDLALDFDGAKKLYLSAVEALPGSLKWKQKAGQPLAELTVAPKLADLVRRSRAAAGAGEAED